MDSICKSCEHLRYCGLKIIGNRKTVMTRCSRYEERKLQTNADRIRGMTDEELAVLLEGCICPKDPCQDIDRDTPTDKKRCTKCWLDWLGEEVNT